MNYLCNMYFGRNLVKIRDFKKSSCITFFRYIQDVKAFIILFSILQCFPESAKKVFWTFLYSKQPNKLLISEILMHILLERKELYILFQDYIFKVFSFTQKIYREINANFIGF